MRMLDLFCGLGGASAAFRDVGWEVIGVDIEPKFHPEIVADLTNWHWEGGKVDLIWASPPCTYFSRHGQPGLFPNEPEPSMDLVNATYRIIREVTPAWYVIENVKGAIPYLGKPKQTILAVCLWGFFPPLGKFNKWVGYKACHHYKDDAKNAWRPSTRDPAERAVIHPAISDRLLFAITNQLTYW